MSGRQVVVVLILASLTACRVERTERPPLADPGAAARVGIEVVLEEFEASLMERDPRRATTFFAPDARLMLDGGTEHSGRGEIAVGLEQALRADSSTLDLRTESIDVSAGVAWQLGTFERVPSDSTAAAARGRFVIRWERGPDATWRMHRVLLATFPADAAAPADSATSS